MRVTVGAPDFGAAMDGSERAAAASLTAAMRAGTVETKQALRDQVTSAGLGARLANTWRGNTYPDGSDSLDPAGYLWSNAPAIVAAFDAGAQILPLNGKKFLWVPTPNVPRSRLGGSRGGKKLASPPEVEAVFNQDLTIFPDRRNGHPLAFVDASVGRSRRLRSAAKARGDMGKRQLILMFTLVPEVHVRKLLDLQGAADAFTARWPALLAGHWQ